MKNLTLAMLGKFIALALLILIGFAVKAQTPKLIEKSFNFKVARTYYGKADSVYIFIYEGGKLGVKVGQQGKVYGVHSTEKPNRSQKELGYSTVVRIMGDTIIAKTTLYKPEQADDRVMKGDYLSLDINLPQSAYGSIFRDLAFLQITFTDNYKERLYTLNQVLFKDSKKLEDSLLTQCAADVKEIYDMLKNDSAQKVLFTKAPDGRYKGKTCMEIMGKVTNRDILSFLKFVRSYPGKYLGNSYKISETFATWVINNAPISNDEILDSLYFYAANKTKYEQYLIANKKIILKDGYVKGWAYDANILASEGKSVESDKLMKEVLKVGTFLKDTAGIGFYHFLTAQILQDKQQYAQALVSVNNAISYFQQAGAWEYIIRAKLKKLYLENTLSDFAAALSTYNNLNEDFKAFQQKLEPKTYTDLLGKNFSYHALTLRRKGDFTESKQFYRKAALTYGTGEDFNSKIEMAYARECVADIETLQSNYTGAISVYDSLIVIYKSMNQTSKQSYALNSKAYAYSKMGQYENNISAAREALAIQLKNNDWSKAGYSFSQIGQSLWSLGKFNEAVAAHQQSIVYRKNGNNYEGMGYSYSKIGSLYIEIGDKLKAIAAMDSAKICYVKAGLKDKLAEIDGTIGDVYKGDKNIPKAVSHYLGAYESLKALGLKQEMADQLYKIAAAYYMVDPTQSRKYYLMAYELYQTIGLKSDMLYCLLNLGNLDTKETKFESAERYFNQALAIGKEINGKREQAMIYYSLGRAAHTKLNLEEAISKFNQSLAIYKEIDEKAEQSSVLLSLADSKISLGKFDLAEVAMQEALAISTSTNNHGGKADALMSLSHLYQLKGQFAESKVMIDSCFKIYRELNNTYQIANTYILAGNYYNRIFDNINAIKSYKMADSLYLVEQDPDARFTSLNNMGTIYFYQADYVEALKFFNQAYALIQKQVLTTDSKLLVLTNMGEVYYHQKNYPEAEQMLLLTSKLSSEKNAVRAKANATLVLGKLYYDKKDYVNAIANLKNTYDYGNTTKENSQLIESSLYLGKIAMAQKKEAEAVKYLTESIAYSIKAGDSKNLWEALYNRGLVYQDQNKLDSAVVYFKRAVTSLQEVEKHIYGGAAAKKMFAGDEKKVNLYNNVISSLIKLGKTEEALEYTSNSNIQALKESMGKIEIVTSDQKKISALKQKQELANLANSVEKNIAEEKAKPAAEQSPEKILSLQKVQQVAQAQLLNFVDSMVRAYPDLQENFVKNVNPEELKKYKSKIPLDVAVLLYVIRENQLIIFTLTHENTKAKLIPISGTEMSAYINDFSKVLKQPFKDKNAAPLNLRGAKITNMAQSSLSLAETGGNLFQLLIDPIIDDIKGKTKLCIINNGELSSIPFQAIGKKDNKGVFRYLVEDYAIFYTNRLDIFTAEDPSTQEVQNRSFVAYGNPDHSLPNAEKEVKEINKIMTTATVYVGDSATEDQAKTGLTTKKIVHFATHGILDYNDFSKTFLKFAKSATNDGKLTIQEIKGLDIEDCDLVTLSACETAVSQNVNKGWYVSPANSFLVNGVKSVVASLWSVDDEATSLLMSSFYENMQKKMPRSEALRKAQETLSHNPKFVHPFYWGAFILYGEWR